MRYCMSNKLHFLFAFLATIAPVVFLTIWFLSILVASYFIEIQKEWVEKHFSHNFVFFMCVSCALVSVLLTFSVTRFHKKRNKLIENPLKIYTLNATLFPLSFFLIINGADFLLPKNLSQEFTVFSGLSGMVVIFFLGSFLVSKSTDLKFKKTTNHAITQKKVQQDTPSSNLTPQKNPEEGPQQKLTDPPLQKALLCPSCKKEMVKRRASNGPNAGNLFWVCSKFPTCKTVLPTD